MEVRAHANWEPAGFTQQSDSIWVKLQARPEHASMADINIEPFFAGSLLVTSQILCVLCPPTALHDCAHEDEDASGEELSSDDEEELLVSAVEVKVPADFATNDLGWVWRAVHVRTIH